MAVTSANWKNDEIYRWFHEYPKQSPAIAAVALYCIASLAIVILTVRTKAWFMLTVAITGFLEMGGYAARVQMLNKPSFGAYVGSQSVLIICPVLLSIVNYIAVGKILRLVDTSKGWLQPAWVARLFTTSDVLCLLLQGTGGGMQPSKDAGTRKLGNTLLLLGLGAQLGFFAIFTSMTIFINISKLYGLRGDLRFQPVFICLFCTIVLMFVRNVFRVIEFSQGYLGYLATHEAYFYIFDFAMIFSCFLFYIRFHFGFYLSSQATADIPKAESSVTAISASSSGTELVPHHPGYESAHVQKKNEVWV